MARFEEQLNRVNDVLEKSMSLKFAVEGVLHDKVLFSNSINLLPLSRLSQVLLDLVFCIGYSSYLTRSRLCKQSLSCSCVML